MRAVWCGVGGWASAGDAPHAWRQSCHVFGGSTANEPEETRGASRFFLESKLESILSVGL